MQVKDQSVREMEDFRKTCSNGDWRFENRRQVYTQKLEPPRSSKLSTSTAPTSSWNNRGSKYTSSWSFTDPELKRQRRIVKYKAYAVEGKMKASLRNGLRWVKNKYCELVHGY